MTKKLFQEGNEYRYTSENKPPKRTTLKSVQKTFERLLGFTSEQLSEYIADANTPLFFKQYAKKIMDGELLEVSDIISKYNCCTK